MILSKSEIIRLNYEFDNSKLINENKLLKSKVNKLELVTRKFFTRDKSFNMLFENQLFENKRNAFGFTKVSKYEQTTNNTVKGKSVIPKHVKTIPIWVPKGTNIKSLKVKQNWVPKGTYINSFGSPQTYFSKSFATNNHGLIKTNRS